MAERVLKCAVCKVRLGSVTAEPINRHWWLQSVSTGVVGILADQTFVHIVGDEIHYGLLYGRKPATEKKVEPYQEGVWLEKDNNYSRELRWSGL